LNGASRPPPLWLADWSDSEDDDFRTAFRLTGLEARVLRSAPLGPTVGTRLHRVRSWPAYTALALRGLRQSNRAPLIAWQPLAGALAGFLRRGSSPPIVALNPMLESRPESLRQRLALAGLRRVERVLFFSRGGLAAATTLGLERQQVGFVPLGVRARRSRPAPPGRHLIAAGREERDWVTLARAADGLDVEVHVLGPKSVPKPLRLLPQVGRERFLELVEEAAALVVPLLRADRTAGQLAVLDAMSVGRAVVATRAQGTEDYVTPEVGFLVPPGDAESLRDALMRVSAPDVATAMGTAALEATRGPLSLERFVREIDAEARRLV
jgi:glycosyltransferase involved in cell wall biosynthesis